LTHLEVEQIQRLLHGELGALEGEVSKHLAECVQCRRLVDEAGREENRIVDLFRRLDHSPPRVEAEELAGRGRWATIWGRRAAGIVLALGAAGAAYAAPGSPLPAWVDRVAQRIVGAPAPSSESPPVTPTPPAVAGIAVTPGERFTIGFALPQARGVATVWLTDGHDIVVSARNGRATFTSGVDGLTVDNRESAADYEIELPRSARRIEIRVGSRRLLLKEEGRIVAPTPADSLGRYRLDLVATGR
jgi:hypothetical protein